MKRKLIAPNHPNPKPKTEKKPKTEQKPKIRTAETNPSGINKIPWPTKMHPNAIYIDEVGRGAWMGPMSLGAVFLLPGFADVSGIHDSKLLKEHERHALVARLMKDPNVIWHIENVSNTEIDELHMSRAWHVGVKRCVEAMMEKLRERGLVAECVVVDGTTEVQDLALPVICEAQADSIYVGVAAAANFAKVHRDAFMVLLSPAYPEFTDIMVCGKGYAWKGTVHKDLLLSGIHTDLHRKSFEPLKSTFARKVVMPV